MRIYDIIKLVNNRDLSIGDRVIVISTEKNFYFYGRVGVITNINKIFDNMPLYEVLYERKYIGSPNGSTSGFFAHNLKKI